MSHRPVLIVAHDAHDRGVLSQCLAGAGFAPSVAASSAAMALLAAGEAQFRALFLATDLPDANALALCDDLRRLGLTLPILLVGRTERLQDVVRGFEAGANDFIGIPLRPSEVVARLHAQLRAFESSADATLGIGPYLLRPAEKTLQDPAGRRIRLTAKEVNILKFLYRADGEAIGRAELLREVWGYGARISTHTLETHIYRLRRKIEPDPANPRVLLTGRAGYHLAQGRHGTARDALQLAA